MEIYYINSEEFFKQHDTDFLRKYAEGKEFKSVKRFIQYSIGRYLVKSVAKKFYEISDTEIIIKNDKPEFKSGEIKFSISHSGKYIMAAFDNTECGLDIEEIKPRDINALSNRYNKEFATLEDFYKFWTEYEAEIKLQQKPISAYSTVFKNDYMLTVVSDKIISSQPSCKDFLCV